jgi:hypothetical protein
MLLLDRQGYRVAWDGNGEAVAAAEALLASLAIAPKAGTRPGCARQATLAGDVK